MITFRIKRYNPEKQAESYFEDFQLDVQEDLTLLDCMNEIKWTLDGSLTYRMSCVQCKRAQVKIIVPYLINYQIKRLLFLP